MKGVIIVILYSDHHQCFSAPEGAEGHTVGVFKININNNNNDIRIKIKVHDT